MLSSRVEKALINRDFARLWAGQAVSTVGDFVFNTTLTLWITVKLAPDQRWAPAAASGLIVVVSLAVLVVGPLAGVFVDRWNRRRTMLTSEAFRAVVVGALAAVAFLPIHALPVGAWIALIYTAVFAVNVAACFFNPARQATISDIVADPVERAKASGVGQATTATAAIIGPPLAAPLLFVAGFQWAVILNGLSYVFSYAAVRSVQKVDSSGGAEHGPSSFRAEFLDGLRLFRRTRILVTVATLAVIANFGAGAWNALEVFFLPENLHVDRKLYGLMGMTIGIGMVIGSLLASRVVARIGAGTALWSALGVSGLLIVLYARQTSFPFGLAAVFATSMPIAMVNTAVGPIIFGAVPKEFLGRVIAVFAPLNELSTMLSALIAGLLYSSVMHDFHAKVGGVHLGPIDTIFSAVGVLFLASATYGMVALPKDAGAAESPAPAEAAAEPAV